MGGNGSDPFRMAGEHINRSGDWITPLSDSLENLILDLIEWLARSERTYEETLAAWRTSCPRFTVWEDANDRGLVRSDQGGSRAIVRPTPAGMTLLQERRPEVHGQLRSVDASGPRGAQS